LLRRRHSSKHRRTSSLPSRTAVAQPLPVPTNTEPFPVRRCKDVATLTAARGTDRTTAAGLRPARARARREAARQGALTTATVRVTRCWMALLVVGRCRRAEELTQDCRRRAARRRQLVRRPRQRRRQRPGQGRASTSSRSTRGCVVFTSPTVRPRSAIHLHTVYAVHT